VTMVATSDPTDTRILEPLPTSAKQLILGIFFVYGLKLDGKLG